MKKIFFGDFWVNIKNKNDLINKILYALTTKKSPSVFFYLNSASYHYQTLQKNFYPAINKADYVYLNSYYLGIIFMIFFKQSLTKINAEDFFPELMSLAGKNRLKIFIFGGERRVSYMAIKNLKKKYRRIKIDGYYGYFKNDFQAIRKIDKFSPDILVVGLGSGHQEPWIIKNLTHFQKIKLIITVGNFIDILGEKTKTPSSLIKRLKIEWLYRLIIEPKRLWKRYLFGGYIVLKQFILSSLLKKSQN